MYEVYFESFKNRISLTDEEEALIKNHLSVKKIRKRQYLLQEEDPCRHIAFVEKGMLRSYTVDKNGTEHILQFAPEGWFIADLYSFLAEEPSSYNIEAVEDSELVLISRPAYNELLKTSPKYLEFSHNLVTNAYIAMQRRINDLHERSIEERYADFISRYPQIINRVPQHMIASYLGLTPETLSRVRRRMVSPG